MSAFNQKGVVSAPGSRGPVRVVTAAALFDGHDASINIMRRLLQAQGAEVIHLGHDRSVEDVVAAVVQEDADAVGVSILSAAHMTVFPRVLQELRSRELDHVLLTGGGIFPPEDLVELRELGVGQLFEPGDPMEKFVGYIREEVTRRRSSRASA